MSTADKPTDTRPAPGTPVVTDGRHFVGYYAVWVTIDGRREEVHSTTRRTDAACIGTYLRDHPDVARAAHAEVIARRAAATRTG